MDSTDVYIKTTDGQDEIATRARQLPARLRSLLIMVDGKRSVGEVLAHNPAPAEAQANLAALLDAGLIGLVSKPKPAGPPATAAPHAAVAPAPRSLAPNATLPGVKKFICTTLQETLGPDADLFTRRVEEAPSLTALLVEAEKIREILRGMGSGKKADLFWEKLNAMLA
jgi:hypothetical protein